MIGARHLTFLSSLDGQLFEKIAEIPHQSCLLLTSREKTPEIARLKARQVLFGHLKLGA